MSEVFWQIAGMSPFLLVLFWVIHTTSLKGRWKAVKVQKILARPSSQPQTVRPSKEVSSALGGSKTSVSNYLELCNHLDQELLDSLLTSSVKMAEFSAKAASLIGSMDLNSKASIKATVEGISALSIKENRAELEHHRKVVACVIESDV